MSTEIQVQSKTVDELFKLQTGYNYKVPEYQRPFSWNKDTAQEFILDLLSSHKYKENGIFIGAFIFINNKDDKSYEVIDGQQRLLNLTILISVIRDLCKKEKGNEEKAEALNNNIIKPSNIKDGEVNRDVVLEPEQSNAKFFKEYIQHPKEHLTPIWLLKKKENKLDYDREEQNKSIIDTYHIYREHILEEFPEDDGNLTQNLMKFYEETLMKTTCAEMVVSDEDKADEIFQAINSKRVQLTTADQIKSKIFSNYKREGTDVQLDKAKRNWTEIQETLLNSGYLDEKTFITYYWASEYGYISNRRIFKAAKEKFETKDKNASKEFKNWSGFLDELYKCSEDLNIIMHPNQSNLKDTYGIERKNTKDVISQLNALNSFNNKTWHVLLFSLFRNLRESKYKQSFVKKLNYLVDFTFLYFDIMKEPSNWYFDAIHTCATRLDNVCDSGGDAKKIEMEWLNFQQKLFIYISDEIDEDKFTSEFLKNVRYKKDKTNLIKYVLSKFENNSEFNLFDEKFEIEHILPREPKLWGLKKIDIKPFVHQIGNLLVLTKTNNQSASNKVFEDKLEIYKKSKLNLVKDTIEKRKDWNFTKCETKDFSSIEYRSNELAKKAYKIWYLDLKEKLGQNIPKNG